jgi:hypothetical protein
MIGYAMTYMPSSRDFDFQPKNRYAAMRMGVAQPANRPIDASDLHRLSKHLMTGVVAIVIAVSIATILPTSLEAFSGVTGMLDTLGPAAY